MRWALVGPGTEAFGGIAAHQRRIATALAASGHEVATFGFSRLYPGFAGEDRSRLGAVAEDAPGPERRVEGEELDVLRPATWARSAARAREFSPDVLLFEYWHPLVVPAYLRLARAAGDARRVVVVHNARPHEPFPAAGAALSRLLESADQVCVHSETVARALPPGIRACRLGLPPLVELSCAVAPPEAAEAGLESGFVLVPGPQRAYKRPGAWPELARRLRDAFGVRLLVAGARRLGGGSRGLARAADRGDLLYWDRYFKDPELVWLLSRATTLLLPYARSSQSGWPAVAEALEVPLVAARVGGLAEQCLPSPRVIPVPDGDWLAALGPVLTEPLRRPIDAAGLVLAEQAARAAWRELCAAIEQPVAAGRPMPVRSRKPRSPSLFPSAVRGMLRVFR